MSSGWSVSPAYPPPVHAWVYWKPIGPARRFTGEEVAARVMGLPQCTGTRVTRATRYEDRDICDDTACRKHGEATAEPEPIDSAEVARAAEAARGLTWLALAFFLTILSCIPAQAADSVDFARPLAVYGLASTADGFMSHRALARCPGCRERNIMGPTWGPAASGAVMLTADLVLQKKGRRREARILRAVYVGACTVFVVKAATVRTGR